MEKPLTLIRDNFSKTPPNCVAAIGNFDGLHLGHKKIIEHVVNCAKLLRFTPTVITFEPLPPVFLRPDEPYFRLMSLRQKIQMLASFGIEQVICFRFKNPLAKQMPLEFIQNYLQRCGVKHLVLGSNFRFGHQKKGCPQLLRQIAKDFGFTVEVLELLQKEKAVSSSAVRAALLAGKVEEANGLLGRNFSVSKRVIRGAQRGRQLGFPTLNFPLKKNALFLNGVFVNRIHIGGKTYLGVSNIGHRPTVDGKSRVMEVHLLDFSGDLYGQRVEVEFLRKLRDEKKFADMESLRAQIKTDITQAKEIYDRL